MTTPAKLTAFAAGLAVLFGGGALAGAAIGPDIDDPVTTAHGSDTKPQEHSDMNASTTEPAAEHDGGHQTAGAAPQPVRGLAVAEGGLRVVVEDPELRRGRAERLTFRIVDERGETVRDFDVEHTKRMHLILARRDLTGFQHLHPEQDSDGTWTTTVRLPDAGSYRLFADFSHQDEARTLASDLRVDGPADLEALPAPQAAAVSDGGYDVRLDAGDARPGQGANLRFTITKDGAAVQTEPYLGAGGHLVALRDGDLAFLHVHPTGDGPSFAATFPSEGRYRLFLQFKHEGRVQTVAFTQEVK
jgi:hypothetical protein